MINIAICPGHYDSYKGVDKNGVVEFDICDAIVSRISAKANALDSVKVFVVKGTLIDKINQINELRPDMAIEVHLGNSNNQKVRGTRSFFMINNDESKNLADTLVASCTEVLGTENKGSWVGWYKKIGPKLIKSGKAPEGWKPKIDIFLSKLVCASAIIEPFFISSPQDCKEFVSDNHLDQIADAILNGALKYKTA